MNLARRICANSITGGNNMKKLLATVLALVMVLSVTSALANATVVSSYTLDGSIYFNRDANTYAYREDYGDPYQIKDAKGNALTDAIYPDVSTWNEYYEVTMSADINSTGVLNGQGVEVVPAKYGDINYIGGKWLAAYTYVEGTVDNYDAKSYSQDDAYYLIGNVDIYFDGKCVGTLGRTEYEYADDYGDYVIIKSRDNKYHAYNKDFVLSAYPETDYLSEFEYDYSSGTVTHTGSNQQAFAKGCTLTPEEVTQDVYISNRLGKDLQGNILFDLTGVADYCDNYRGNYARFEKDDLYGLIDKQGNVVVPCEYDEIPVVSYEDYPFLHQGYQPVVKDGNIGIVDMAGNLVYLSRYSEDVARTYNFPFISVEDTNGETIVISIAGEFQEHFTDARFYGNSQIFTAKNSEGKYVVKDISGNDVIPPFEADYASFNVSNDGSLMMVYMDGDNTIYEIAIDGNFTPLGDLPSLDCTCGYHTDDMSFNFCPMCGTQFAK